MKRFIVMLVFAAFCAAALFAVDRIYCKWCGSSNFANARQMISSPCAKSPRGYHEAM